MRFARQNLWLIVFCAALGCSAKDSERAQNPSAPVTAVPEIFRTQEWPAADVDSPALWRDDRGGAILFVTAKQADAVYACDGLTGKFIAALGRKGSALGRLSRPNGLAVIGDFLFVAERDNHRVQVFEIPSFKPLLVFGEDALLKPYGLTIFERNGAYDLYVTDDYPAGNLGARVKHFRLTKSGGRLEAKLVRAFGESSGAGALHKVETILADPSRNRLLISDEVSREIKVYDLEGRFTLTTLGKGIIKNDPEGLALFEDDSVPSGGWIVATDQGPKQTVLHVFARDTGRYAGGFTGKPTLANTDGIWLSPGDLVPFKRGALYCVHNDARVQAYSWADVEQALKLK